MKNNTILFDRNPDEIEILSMLSLLTNWDTVKTAEPTVETAAQITLKPIIWARSVHRVIGKEHKQPTTEKQSKGETQKEKHNNKNIKEVKERNTARSQLFEIYGRQNNKNTKTKVLTYPIYLKLWELLWEQQQ